MNPMMEPQPVVPTVEGGVQDSPSLGTSEGLTRTEQLLNQVPVQPTGGRDIRTPSSGLRTVNHDSLYKYTSWEDPSRTMMSYGIVMATLFGTHYLPLTRTALKAGATILGVVATTEYAQRLYTPNTLLARLRPRQYRKVPEPVLKDTLRDVHDLIQYSVVKAQKIALGEDLDKTFAAFVGMFALFWLAKIASPFGLVVLGVNAVYIAPLVNSRRGREVMQDAKVRAEELSTAAAQNVQVLADQGKAKATELSAQAQATAQNAQRRAGELAQSGSQAATDMSAQAKDKASDLSESFTMSADSMPPLAQTTEQSAPESVMDAARNTLAKDDLNKPKTKTFDDILDAPSKATFSPAIDAGDSHYELQNSAQGLKNAAGATPRHVAGIPNPYFAENAAAHPEAGDQAGTTGIMGRPRGVSHADIDGAPAFGKFEAPTAL
jgi:hypothetical protein